VNVIVLVSPSVITRLIGLAVRVMPSGLMLVAWAGPAKIAAADTIARDITHIRKDLAGILI
jgi:hypothetical protein